MQSRIILSTKGAEFILNSGATLDDGAAALVPRFSLDFGACVPLGSATWSLALPRGAAGSGAAPDAAPVRPRRCGWRNNAHSAACWAAPEGAQLCDVGSAAARAACAALLAVWWWPPGSDGAIVARQAPVVGLQCCQLASL